MGTKVYPCPLCGRSVGRHGDPFEDKHKAVAHINGSHDGQHKGELGEDYVEEIEENAIEKTEMQVQADEPAGTGPADPSEISVEMRLSPEMEPEEMPLDDAMGVLASAAFEPEAFGHTPLEDFQTLDGRTDDIEGEVDRLQKQVEELREAIETLALYHDGSPDWEHFLGEDPFEGE